MADPGWFFKPGKKDTEPKDTNLTFKSGPAPAGGSYESGVETEESFGRSWGVEDNWVNALDEDALRAAQLKALYKATEAGANREGQKPLTLADITGDANDKKVSFKEATTSTGLKTGKFGLDIEGFTSLTPDEWRESLPDDDREKKKSAEFMIAQAMITGKGKDKPGELKDRPRTEGEPEVKPEDIPEVKTLRSGTDEWSNVLSWAQDLMSANPDYAQLIGYVLQTHSDDFINAFDAGLNPGDEGWPDFTGYQEWTSGLQHIGQGGGFGGTGGGQPPNIDNTIWSLFGGGQDGQAGQDTSQFSFDMGEEVGSQAGFNDPFGIDSMFGPEPVSLRQQGGGELAGERPSWWPSDLSWPPITPGTEPTQDIFGNITPGKPTSFNDRLYDSVSEAMNPMHGIQSAYNLQKLKQSQDSPSRTQSINVPGTNAYIPAIVDGKGNITQMDLPNLESQIDRAIMAGDVNTVRTLMGVRDMPSPVEKLNLAMQIARTPADMFQISRLAGGESMDRFGAMAPFLSQAVQDVFSPTDHLSGLQPMGSRAGMLQSHPQSYQQPYPQQGMGAGTPTEDIRSVLTQGDERFGGGGFAIDPEMEAWKRANAGQPEQVTAPPVSQAFRPDTGPNNVAQSAMANAASGLGYHGLAQQFSGMPRVYGPDPEEEFTTIGQNAHFSGYGGAGGMSPRVGNVILEGDPIAKPSSLFSTLGLRVPSMQATQAWLPEERTQAEEYVRGLGIDPARLWDEVKIGTPGGGMKPGIRWKESFLD